MPDTTYYALVNDDHPAERPAGLVRRIHTVPVPTDEILTRDLTWQPTDFLHRYWLGHNDQDYVEITEAHADAVIDAWRSAANG
ncbi:hypothetical protein [Actinomadura gamaensis]|uniref:Uncharacterized protein n=1 Tax=Actinomadura gamaensis TaxID=1763541 RepID=A0ABV9TXM8_9ACTN